MTAMKIVRLLSRKYNEEKVATHDARAKR